MLLCLMCGLHAQSAKTLVMRGYQLVVPDGWTAESSMYDGCAMGVTAEKEKGPFVLINVMPVTARMGNMQQPGYQELSRGTVTADGRAGVDVTALLNMGTPPRRQQARSVSVQGKELRYDFIYLARPDNFAAHAADFNAILQSIRWKDIDWQHGPPFKPFFFASMSNMSIQEVPSPGGRYVATLSYRDGLTYGFQFLSLQTRAKWHPLHADDPVPADEVGEMGDAGITGIRWLNERTLLMRYDRAIPADCFVKKGQCWHNVRLLWRAETSH